MKLAKILFFIAGALPTKSDYENAAKLKATVVFRNAAHVPNEPHALEKCDGVAGEVPAIYKKKFPTAEKAIEANKAEFKKLTDAIDDEPPKKLSELSEEEIKQAAEDKAKAEFEAGQNGNLSGGVKPPAWNANK